MERALIHRSSTTNWTLKMVSATASLIISLTWRSYLKRKSTRFTKGIKPRSSMRSSIHHRPTLIRSRKIFRWMIFTRYLTTFTLARTRRSAQYYSRSRTKTCVPTRMEVFPRMMSLKHHLIMTMKSSRPPISLVKMSQLRQVSQQTKNSSTFCKSGVELTVRCFMSVNLVWFQRDGALLARSSSTKRMTLRTQSSKFICSTLKEIRLRSSKLSYP